MEYLHVSSATNSERILRRGGNGGSTDAQLALTLRAAAERALSGTVPRGKAFGRPTAVRRRPTSERAGAPTGLPPAVRARAVVLPGVRAISPATARCGEGRAG